MFVDDRFLDRALYKFYSRPVLIGAIDEVLMKKPQTKAEKNQARLKQLRGRAGRWA